MATWLMLGQASGRHYRLSAGFKYSKRHRLEALFETLRFVLEPLPKIFGLLLIVLVVLYLLDRL